MPKPLVVTISHSLGKDEAVRRLKGGLAKATTTLPMFSLDEEVWTGDIMQFRMSAMGHQAFGNVDVAEDNVRIEVTLPWLLQRFGRNDPGRHTAEGPDPARTQEVVAKPTQADASTQADHVHALLEHQSP